MSSAHQYNMKMVAEKSRPEGVILAGMAAFLVSVCSLISKLCCQLPAGQLYHAGAVGLLMFSIGVNIAFRTNPFPRGYRMALLLYSITATQASLASYQAVRLLPLSDEALLAYGSIPLTSLLACRFLGESCGPTTVISCLLVMTGLGMVCQPGLEREGDYPYYLIGVAVAFYSACCDAISYILIKKLRGLPFFVTTFNLALVSVIFSAPLAFFETWTVPASTRAVLTFVALFVMFEVYFTLAMNTEKAGLVALVQASDIAFAYIWETIYFEEPYSLLKIIGSVIIVSVVCLNVLFNKS